MTITEIRVSSSDGHTVLEGRVVTDDRDEAIARAFFERVKNAELIDTAVIEYFERVAENRPYEDAGSVDELRRIGHA